MNRSLFCLGDRAQNLAYTLSYVALIEFSHNVIGVGSSFYSMDLIGLALAQIKKTLEDITPLKTAVNKTLSAMNLLQNQQIEEAVAEFRGAKDDAQTAFQCAKSLGKDLHHIQQVSIATRIIILAKLCIYSYDKNSQTIEPFHCLDDSKQRAIAIELERDCKDFIEYHQKVKVGFFSLKKDNKKEELQSIKNELLKIVYPYISEGKKYTCSTRMLGVEFEIEYDSDLIPEAEANATMVKLGTRKNNRNKITETFYKLPNGSVDIGNTCEAIEWIEKKEFGKTMKFRLIKYFICSQDCLSGLRFIRTTEQGPIFWVEALPVRDNKFFDMFFLYWSSTIGWYCSPSIKFWEEDSGCVLRNRTPQNKGDCTRIASTEWLGVLQRRRRVGGV